MNKNYCNKCNKYIRLKNPKISYIFHKTLALLLYLISRCNVIEIIKTINLIKSMN